MTNTTEINLLTANNFTSTKVSREQLMLKLSKEEQRMFKYFIKSVGGVK